MILFRKISWIRALHFQRLVPIAAVLVAVAITPLAAHAAASPWENAVTALETSFTGPIARGLSLVAIVWGGLTFAFSEGGDSKRMLAGILFGVGMAIGAVNFMLWLFP
jgi:type IV secretory pathway VirB2 component (pilin)